MHLPVLHHHRPLPYRFACLNLCKARLINFVKMILVAMVHHHRLDPIENEGLVFLETENMRKCYVVSVFGRQRTLQLNCSIALLQCAKVIIIRQVMRKLL